MKTTFIILLFLAVSCQKSTPEPVNYTGNYIYKKTNAPMSPGYDMMIILKQRDNIEATVYDSSQVYFLSLKKNGFQYSGNITMDNRNVELRIYQHNGKTSGFYLVSFPDPLKNYGFIGELEKQ